MFHESSFQTWSGGGTGGDSWGIGSGLSLQFASPTWTTQHEALCSDAFTTATILHRIQVRGGRGRQRQHVTYSFRCCDHVFLLTSHGSPSTCLALLFHPEMFLFFFFASKMGHQPPARGESCRGSPAVFSHTLYTCGPGGESPQKLWGSCGAQCMSESSFRLSFRKLKHKQDNQQLYEC